MPIPLGDAVWFYPIAYTFANKGTLAHPFLNPLADSGGGALVWHGWLYPYVMGTLARWTGGTMRAVYLGEVLLMAVGLMAALRLVAQRLDRHRLLAGAVVVVAGSALWASAGRPELLALVLLMWGVVFLPYLRGWTLPLAGGVLLGLVAITQPTVGLLAALALTVAFAYTYAWRICLAYTAAAAAAALLTTVIATWALYPYGVGVWLGGLAEHAARTASRQNDRLGYYFLFLPNQPLVGLWFVLGAGVGGWLLASRRARPGAPLVFGGTLVLLAAAAWYLGVRVPPTHYNITVFVPLIAWLVAIVYARIRDGRMRRLIQVSVVGLAISIGLGTARVALVAVSSLTTGVRANAAEAGVETYLRAGHRVTVPASLLAAMPALHGRDGVQPASDRHDAGNLLVVQQAGSGQVAAPTVPGHKLLEDRFRPHPVTLGGVRIANTPLTYELAVYRPEASKSENDLVRE